MGAPPPQEEGCETESDVDGSDDREKGSGGSRALRRLDGGGEYHQREPEHRKRTEVQAKRYGTQKSRSHIDLHHVTPQVGNGDDGIYDRREAHEESGQEEERRTKGLAHLVMSSSDSP